MFLNGIFFRRISFVFLSIFLLSQAKALVPQAIQSTQSNSVQNANGVVAGEADKTDIFFICKRDRSIRWLRAYKLENGKCKTIYSKEGYLQVISSATYFASCEAVLLSVKKNIEEGGFKCASTPVSVIELESE